MKKKIGEEFFFFWFEVMNAMKLKLKNKFEYNPEFCEFFLLGILYCTTFLFDNVTPPI